MPECLPKTRHEQIIMCLVRPTTINPLVAKHDIYVFKEVACRSGKLITPYMNTPITSKILEADFLDPVAIERTNYYGKPTTAVEHGIHSYRIKLKVVLRNLGFMLQLLLKGKKLLHTDLVVLAKIPKGTRYYTNGNQYCSQCIKIINFNKCKLK